MTDEHRAFLHHHMMMALSFAIREHVHFNGTVASKMYAYLMGIKMTEYERGAVLGKAIDEFIMVTDMRLFTAEEEAALTPEGREMRDNIRMRQAMEMNNGPRAQA